MAKHTCRLEDAHTDTYTQKGLTQADFTPGTLQHTCV